MKIIDALPYPVLLLLAVTLGLAPFVPQPHLLEKTMMLFRGELSRPVDIFDFFLHGSPVFLLLAKILRGFFARRTTS